MNADVLERAMGEGDLGSEVRTQVISLLEASGAMAWPIDEQALATHFGQKLARGASNLAWDDLCLAFAVAHRVDAAWSALQRRAGPSVRVALSRILSPAQAEDLEQCLFAELASGASSPLLGYSGNGSLMGWLLVTVTRRAWKASRRQRGVTATDDDALLERVLEGQRDPAMELFKQQHADTFRACIKSAFVRLTAKDRNLLRLHHLDGVQTAELARMHGVHRATIVRWLADARLSFVSNFRDEFATRLNAPRLEVDSLARVFLSGLDISLPMASSDSGDVPEAGDGPPRTPAPRVPGNWSSS
jgi:RNA polymerase sigma-70 factor (ECF subfamily)